MDTVLDLLEKFGLKKIKLSCIKRRECIYQIERLIREQSKEETKKVQDRLVVALISSQMTTNGGHLMMMAIVKCLCLIFEIGDYSKITSSLINPLCQSIESSSSKNQISSEERLSKIFVVSKVFLLVKQSVFVGSPPSKELVELFTKIGAKSSDSQIRIYCYQALTRVIKAAPQNLSIQVPDLVKNYCKLLEKLITCQVGDPDYIVKIQCLKGLRSLVKLNFSYSMLSQYYDQIQTVCFKGFTDEIGESLAQYQKLSVAVFILRLEETQRNGDLKMNYKEFFENYTQGLEKNKKKNTTLPLEAPRTLGEIISFMSAQMYKNHLNVSFVNSVCRTLSLIIEQSPIHFQSCEIDHLLNSVLLSLQKQDQKEQKESSVPQHSAIFAPAFEFFKVIVNQMTNQQRQLFIECVTSTLDKRQLIMNKDTVEWFTPIFNSVRDKLRVSSMVKSHDQTELCLKTYAFLIEVISEGQISQIFQNESFLVSPIMRYLQDQPSISTQIEAKKVIITISRKIQNLLWIQNLLYQFLQLTTIENADLQTFSIGDSANLDQLEQKQKNLNTLAECMSSLLKEVSQKSQEKAVPLALAESTLKVVKGLVLGNFVKSDAQEKQLGIFCYPLKLQEVLDSEELGQSRREAGWILIQGLLAQGDSWMRQNIETFLMLFYSLFNKDICGSQGFTKVSQILREFDLKIRALGALHYLIKTYRDTLLEQNKNHLKLVSSLLCNCLQFLFTNSKDKEAKELVQIFQKAGPRQYKEAKLQMLQCIKMINHPNYFQSKMILILHIVCEQIISSKKMTDQDNLVFPKFLHSKDYIIGGLRNQVQSQQPLINDQLVSMSIELFTRLYLTKGSLTSKNKLQLIKHLGSHSIIDEAKQEVVYPSRLVKIGLTCLWLARGNNLEEQDRNFVLQPLEPEIVQKMQQIAQDLLKFQNKCVGLDRILAELTIAVNLDEIKKNPKSLKCILKGAKDVGMLDSTKSFLIGNLFKVLDYSTIIKESIDIDEDIILFFKQALANKEITPELASVVAYSIFQIFMYCKQEVVPAELYKDLFHLALECLHSAPLSQKFDSRSLHWFGLLAAQLIQDNDPLASSSKIKMIEQQDLTWTIIQGDSSLLDSFIEVEKAKAIQNNLTKVQSFENLMTLIKIFKNKNASVESRIKITQLLSVMILQGSLDKIIAQCNGKIQSVSNLVIDLINYIQRQSLLEEDFKQMTNDNLTVNVENVKILSLLTDSGPDSSDHKNLNNKLNICCSLALKFELQKKGSLEMQIQYILRNLKQMLSFKHVDEYEYLQENPTEKYESFEQAFSSDLNDQTLFEYCNAFYSLLAQMPKDAEKFLKQHLYELITLSFKLTQRDQVKFKQIGVEMMSQVIHIFKDTEERLGDDDNSDDDKGKREAGPLLLEQYEAQIHSVIRSSLQDQLKSFLYAKQLYRLIHQFLTLGICKDEAVISKTIEQLQSLYLTSGTRLEKSKASGGNQDFQTLSQQYPEKIVANSFVQKLSLINEVYPHFVSDMEESYIKLLRDFLIVTCAQAQDSKNPNSIKDIKSLKILYPTGLGCAIDMMCLIQCILSILKLKNDKNATPSSEFVDLSFQCALILLNSQPESLQLTDDNDTIKVIKIRIEILKWFSSDEILQSVQLSNDYFEKLMQALICNFDLGIIQLSHQAIKVYSSILRQKSTHPISDNDVNEIQQKVSNFKKSLSSAVKQIPDLILQDLDDCQIDLLGNLQPSSQEFKKAIENLVSVKLERMNYLVTEPQSPECQQELNKVFQSVLKFVQNPKIGEIGEQILEILRQNLVKLLQLEKCKSMDFVVRAYCMLSFFAFKITNFLSLYTITNYAHAFEAKADKETFTTTMLRLWIKEPDEKLAWPLFAMVTQNVHAGTELTDSRLLSIIEFVMKFYATYHIRTQGGPNKKQTLTIMFALFFTVMQLLDVGMEIKNKCAQCLVQLVNLDMQTFKELVQGNPSESGITTLSAQEKSVIQNLILRMSGTQAPQQKQEVPQKNEQPNSADNPPSKFPKQLGVKKLGGPPKKQ